MENIALEDHLAENKYLGADYELAQLRGWKNISLINIASEVYEDPVYRMIAMDPYGSHGSVPMWSSDRTAAFDLMVEYTIWVKEWVDKSGVEIESRYLLHNRFPTYYTRLDEHGNDKSLAYCFATVQSAISKQKKLNADALKKVG